MLSLLRGPGGPLRRLAAEVVPLLVGGTLGWMAGALGGVGVGAVVGLGAWAGVSAALRAVRARPGPRRLYRLALLAHVLFWGQLGWRESSVEPVPGDGGPPDALAAGTVERAAWAGAEPVALRAGAGEAPLVLPDDTPLGGWGQRPRRAALPAFGGLGLLGRLSRAAMAVRGVHGPLAPLLVRSAPGSPVLSARALLLAGAPGDPPLALVRYDLLTSDAHLAAALAERVRDLGVVPALLLVSATHTHSGPGGYAREALPQVLALDHYDPRVVEALLAAGEQALRAAHAGLRPARLAVAEGRDRGPDGEPILASARGAARGTPLDERLQLLLVEDLDGRPLALVVNHGVHPVAVRRSYPRRHRDVAGTVEDAFAARLGGAPPVLFVQAGLGDVAPRVVLDDEGGQALPRAGERFAAAQTAALDRAWRATRLHVEAVRGEVPLGPPHAWAALLGERRLLLDDAGAAPFGGDWAGAGADALLLPANLLLWSLTLTDVRLVGSLRGAVGVRVALAPQADLPRQPLGLVRLRLADEQGRRALQPLVWMPGEPTQSVAAALRAAGASGAGPDDARPLLWALTNGSMAYATDEPQYRAGGYVAASTLYGAHTSARLVRAVEALRAHFAR